jgi:phage terminase small subunit
MPVLDTQKHELFARALAKGKTATEAYVLAGYAPDDSNCKRLTGNDRIRTRVAEIKERAAARTELTVASITRKLLQIAKEAKAFNEPAGHSVARQAMMDAAKLNGLVIDRAITENWHHDISNSPASEDEWIEAHSTH